MNSNQGKAKLENSLDSQKVEQLHKAVLGLSTQSFELKKLCVTIEVSACTLAVTFFKNSLDSSEFLLTLKIIILVIPILFYVVDITTYYYQDKLRYNMNNLENKIRERNNIVEKVNDRFTKQKRMVFKRLIRSVTSVSNIIYWGLILLGILFFALVKAE